MVDDQKSERAVMLDRTPQHDRIDKEYEELLAKCEFDDVAWACVRRAFQIGILYGSIGR